MRTRLVLAAGIAALAAGLVAAFGRGSSAAPPALGGGAAVAPANAAAFVALDSDLGSSQWQAVDSLLTKVGALSQLQQSFQQRTGLGWDALRSALGPETDVVVLPAASDGKPQVVLLTRPANGAAFEALVHEAAPSAAIEQVGGWTAVSDSQAALDAVKGATTHLSTDPSYVEATGKLTDGAFAQVYANGAEAAQLASSLGRQAGSSRVVWAAGELVAQDGGVTVDGYVRRDGNVQTTQPYASDLVDRIPSGSLAVADFQAGHGNLPASADPLLGALGKVASALGGETAVYVTPDRPFPAVTLVTHASDPQAVVDALSQALASAGSAVGGDATGSFPLGAILGSLRLSHEIVGSDLVVSTSQSAIDAFAGGGAKLASDPAFLAAGIPSRTTGFVYANLKDAAPYLQALLASASKTSGSLDLGALQSLAAYGTGTSGSVSHFTASLRVG
jgi:hypothetical protein